MLLAYYKWVNEKNPSSISQLSCWLCTRGSGTSGTSATKDDKKFQRNLKKKKNVKIKSCVVYKGGRFSSDYLLADSSGAELFHLMIRLRVSKSGSWNQGTWSLGKILRHLHLPGSDEYGIKWTNFKEIRIMEITKLLPTISSIFPRKIAVNHQKLLGVVLLRWKMKHLLNWNST